MHILDEVFVLRVMARLVIPMQLALGFLTTALQASAHLRGLRVVSTANLQRLLESGPNASYLMVALFLLNETALPYFIRGSRFKQVRLNAPKAFAIKIDPLSRSPTRFHAPLSGCL